MQLILRVQSPSEQRSVAFRVGQVVQIGRTEWANLCLASDPSLADIHCEITITSEGCVLRNLATAGQTFLNGEPVDETRLRHGDSITAGASQFQVELTGYWPEADGDDAGAGQPTDAEIPPGPAALVCAQCELDIADFDLPYTATLEQFVTAALEAERYADLTIFLATTLSKQEAVWWLIVCIEQSAAPQDAADAPALEAARAWVNEPNEEHRRAAELAMGPALSPAQQAAMAVFWSGGSIAAPDGPEIPADEGMTARIVRGAVLQLSSLDESISAHEALQAFSESALAIAAGDNRWDA